MELRFIFCLVCSVLLSLVSLEQILLITKTNNKISVYLINVLWWVLTSFSLVFDISATAIYLSEPDAIPIGIICLLPRITHFVGASKILPKEKFGWLNPDNLDSEIIIKSIDKSYLSQTKLLETICLFDVTFFKFLPFIDTLHENTRGWPSKRAMKIGNTTKLFHCVIAVTTSAVWLAYSANKAPHELVIIVSTSFTLASGSFLLQIYETYKSYKYTDNEEDERTFDETKNVIVSG